MPGLRSRRAAATASTADLEDFFAVGDHRRQQAGGAETAMGPGDAARLPSGVGSLVEQGAAAAVDLRIDEARRQDSALEVEPANRRGEVVSPERRPRCGRLR